MSGFEPYRGKGYSNSRMDTPMVTVTESRIHTNKSCREALGHPDRVEYLVDKETGRIGLRPDPEGDLSHAYSLGNRSLTATQLWDDLGIEISESASIEVDTESEEFPVIDMSPFIDRVGESASTAESEPEPDTGPEPERDEREAGEEADQGSDGPEPPADLDELRDVRGVGEKTLANIAEHHGFETVADIANATISDLKEVPGVGRAAASRLTDHAVDLTESEQNGTGGGVLDSERVETALESVGVPTTVSATEFIDAIDDNRQTFGAARDLDIARGDVADLVMRLDLEEELKAGGGRAAERFEEGSA